MIWFLYLILVHIAAFIGICLLAWITGYCIKNGNGKAGESYENLDSGWHE